MTYIPRLQSSGHNWIGDGRIVYSTGYIPNTPFGDNAALQQLYAPYKDAQIQRRASQAADKAARQASRQGHVTVYDAVKKQYVSATPQEADFISQVNKELQAQRRASQVKPLGTGNVTVFDASKGQYVPATPAEAKLIAKSNKRISAIEGLNERITSHMGNKSYYGGKTVKSGGQYISVSGEQIGARVQRRALQQNKSVLDRFGGKTVKVGDQYVAQSQYETARQCINNETARKIGQVQKNYVENALSRKTSLNPYVIDHNLGLDRAAKSAQESASAFVEHGLTNTEKALGGTTKSKGLWDSVKGLFGKAKNALKTGLTKFKAFAKTPKGKWSLAIAAVVIAGTTLFGYVANRFSAKNRPTPTNGPDKIFMPKIEDEVKETEEEEKETEEIEETEKTDKKDKADKAKSDDDEDVDDVDETDETEKAKSTDETKIDETKADETKKSDDTEKVKTDEEDVDDEE